MTGNICEADLRSWLFVQVDHFPTKSSFDRSVSSCYIARHREDCMAVVIRGLAPLLQVYDMPTAIHFYRDVLGFTIFGSSGPTDDCDWAGLRLKGTEVMLNTAYERGARPPVPD